MSILSNVFDHDQMVNITNEFSRLKDRCYLENTGAVLYPQILLQEINNDLLNNVYINPHTDGYTKECIEQIRSLVLKYFNTDNSNYTVIFTSGATQSLKLVAETFRFACNEENSFNNGSFIYLQDNHTSVIGLRELARDRGADILPISHEDFLNFVPIRNDFKKDLCTDQNKRNGNILFAYPAQCNFNGFKYPMECIRNIKNGCLNNFLKRNLSEINRDWYILMDAANYASTNHLDLSKVQPDFVALSFYKIFGYPTGLGALLVKNTSAHVISEKRYFGGGTVDIVVSSENFHVKRSNLAERFEDGTVSFLSIISLKHCFNVLNRLIPKIVSENPMDTISYHTFFLAKDLYGQLNKLRHPNGNKAVVLYMDSEFTDINRQGGIVTFNLLREDGSYIGYAEFQHMADLFNISLRTGCFCNSGACQRHLKVSNRDLKDMYKAGHKCGDEVDLIGGKPTGAIRVSIGYYNTFNDIDKLILMICRCFVKTKYKPFTPVRCSYKVIEGQKHRTQSTDTLNMLNEEGFFQRVNIEPEFTKVKGVLKEIAIFPIKSCGALKIHTSWKIGSKGFQYDREWMIIKENGVCLTQKQNTRMCMIRPEIDLKRKIMTLNFQDKTPITIPLDQTDKQCKDTNICQSKICTDFVKGYDCGDNVAQWISEALEVSFLRLVRQSSADHRIRKTKDQEDVKLLSLSNQAQFLLINKTTVQWLKGKIEDPSFTDSIEELTDRFRGNIIIETEHELVERKWKKIIIGKHEFRVEGLCTRCQMVCIDQRSGEKTVEPLRTISEQFAGKMRFGIYLTHIGSIDGTKDKMLKTNSIVKCIHTSDVDISR